MAASAVPPLLPEGGQSTAHPKTLQAKPLAGGVVQDHASAYSFVERHTLPSVEAIQPVQRN